jgi:hypothetical protein
VASLVPQAEEIEHPIIDNYEKERENWRRQVEAAIVGVEQASRLIPGSVC